MWRLMKAIVYEKYGSPDVLQLKEVEKPIPKDNEVLVKVHAASINDWDWGLLHGTPFVNRLMAGFPKPKRIKILGSDIAGRVEAVGKNVKRFQGGDDVYGDLSGCGFGGFAEYVCAREDALTQKPAGIGFDEAAAIPQVAMLALQGLIDKGEIKQGQKVLLNGAGGGVGTLAVQIAKLYDAVVTGVDSSGKLDMLRSLGFVEVIDYTKEDFTQKGLCYDLILDVKTNRSAFDYARALTPKGIYVTVGGSSALLTQVYLMGPLFSMTSKKKIRMVFLKQNRDLPYMNELLETGKVKPVIDRHYPLSEAAEAMRYYGEGNFKGKVVITMEHHGKT